MNARRTSSWTCFSVQSGCSVRKPAALNSRAAQYICAAVRNFCSGVNACNICRSRSSIRRRYVKAPALSTLRTSAGRLFLFAWLFLRAHPVFVKFVAKRTDADAKFFRGLRAVAAAFFDGVQNLAFLEFAEGNDFRPTDSDRCRGGVRSSNGARGN